MCIECIPKPSVELKLLSTSFCNTPGMVMACINDYKFKGACRNRARRIMRSWQTPTSKFTDEVIDDLLSGRLKYTTVKEYDKKEKMELEHVIIQLP